MCCVISLPLINTHVNGGGGGGGDGGDDEVNIYITTLTWVVMTGGMS